MLQGDLRWKCQGTILGTLLLVVTPCFAKVRDVGKETKLYLKKVAWKSSH